MQVCLVFIYLIQATLLLIAPNLASALSKPQFPQSDSYSHLFATFNVSTPSHYTMRFPLSLFQLEVSCLNCSFNFQKPDAKNFFSFSFFSSNWTCKDFLCIQINIHLPIGAKCKALLFHLPFGAGCKEILFSVYNSTSILHLGRGARILVLVLLLFSLSSSLYTKQHQSNLSVSLYPALHKGAIRGGGYIVYVVREEHTPFLKTKK